LAHALDLPSPPDAELRRTIQQILFDRHAAAAVGSGIMMRAELRDLLLAHLQTLVCENAGVSEPGRWQSSDLLEAVEIALFGESGAG